MLELQRRPGGFPRGPRRDDHASSCRLRPDTTAAGGDLLRLMTEKLRRSEWRSISLIVDDEEDIRELRRRHSERRRPRDPDGATTADARSRRSPTARRGWCSSTSGCRGRSWTGWPLLDQIKTMHPELPVVMISGHGNIETAVLGDPPRRLRLHREAVQGRPPDPDRRARAGDLEAQARGLRS